MERRITQDTFDAVVAENMADFDMPREAAIKDAIEQFSTQRVDLSAIDVSGGEGRDEFTAAFNTLRDRTGDSSAAAEHLRQLRAMCSDGYEHCNRNRNLLVVTAGVSVIMGYLSTEEGADVTRESLELLAVVCKNMIQNNDSFEPGGSERLVRLLRHHCEHHSGVSDGVLCAGFKLAKIVAKSENNKVALMRGGLGTLIAEMLKTEVAGAADLASLTDLDPKAAYLQEMCLAIRGLCIHDDLRRDMSSAYDNGKFFLSADGVVVALLALSKNFKLSPRVSAAALAGLKQFVLSEEAVQVVCMHGAMDIPAGVLGWADAPLILVRSVAGLMRNLCADDKRKNKLVQDGILHHLVRVMSDDRYNVDTQFVDNAAACLAAISLRSQSNSRSIVECGAIEPLIVAMRKHFDKASFQRQACLAIRNIAARGGDDMKTILLDLGMEGVLRNAGALQGAVDEAYAALRDLNCEVSFVSVSMDGSALPVYEQFGTGKNLQFNPVFDETCDINDRVEAEARAPFAKEEVAPPHSSDHSHDHSHGDGCC